MASPAKGINGAAPAERYGTAQFYERQFTECERKILEAVRRKTGLTAAGFEVSCYSLSEAHKQILRDRNFQLHESQVSYSRTYVTPAGYKFKERLTAEEHFDCEHFKLPCQDLDYDYDPKLDFTLFKAQVELITGKKIKE